MNTISAPARTPYRTLKEGLQAVAEYSQDHEVTAAVAVAGTGAAVAGYVAKTAAWTGGRYGAPALGVGIAALGGAAIHDALANDVGRNPSAAADKLVLGTATMMAGTKIAGSALNIPVAKDILTFPGAIGTGMAVTGVALARSAAVRAQYEGLAERHIVVGTVGAAAVPGGLAVAAQGLAHPAIAKAAGKGSLLVGAAGLGGLSWFWGHRASESVANGEQFKGTGYAGLSLISALSSAWVVGKVTGLEALTHADQAVIKSAKGVWNAAVVPAGKFIYQHPVVGGAVVAGALATAAYGYHTVRRGRPVPPPSYGNRPWPPTTEGSRPVPPPGNSRLGRNLPYREVPPPAGRYDLAGPDRGALISRTQIEAPGTGARVVIDVQQQ